MGETATVTKTHIYIPDEWILYEGVGYDKCPYCELPDIERMLCISCMRWDCPRCHLCEEPKGEE